MALVERVKGIILKPGSEWGVIAEETTSTADLYKGYVAPLAGIGAVAGFIGNSVVGRTVPFVGTFRLPMGTGLTWAISTFVMTLVAVFIVSLVVNALAPTFGAEKNPAQALKVAAYSYTPAWVAAAFQILPSLGILGLVGALYALYLLYLGLPKLMKCPPEKSAKYTAVVVLCGIVIGIVIGVVGNAIASPGALGVGGLPGVGIRSSSSSGEVQFDRSSALGKLQEMGKAMEAQNQKMEAARRSGDPNAQAAAAVETLGAMMGGGKRVNPVGIEQLKPFIPESFAGLPKSSSNAEKSGVAGLMVSKASARYSDKGKSVSLDVSDTGGASGMLGLASWAGLQGEREDDNGFERTQKVDGRLVHEKGSKRGGSNEFTVVLGERFIVTARGHGVELGELKSAVTALDLGKLESMKDVGVQK